MEASELVLRYGRPSVCLEGREIEDVASLAWQLMSTLKRRFESTLLADPGPAVLLVDSCDGTPLVTRKRLRRKTELLDVVRSQRSTGE